MNYEQKRRYTEGNPFRPRIDGKIWHKAGRYRKSPMCAALLEKDHRSNGDDD